MIPEETTRHAAQMILGSLESLSMCDLRIDGLDAEETEIVREEIDALLGDPVKLLTALADVLGIKFEYT